MTEQSNASNDCCAPAPSAGKRLLAFPALALLSSLGAMACCLPLGFLGALAAAGGGAIFVALRPWMMGASVLFLMVGFVQLYRRPVCRTRGRTAIVALFWITAALVFVLFAFPQVIANLAAGSVQ